MKNPYESAVSFDYALLDSYKRLCLSENEVMVLLVCDLLSKQGNKAIVPDALAFKMNLKDNELDALLSALINKGFLEYVKISGKLVLSLDKAKAKAFEAFANNMVRIQNTISDKERANKLSDLSSFFEEHLNRTLSPLERSSINDWLEAGYTLEEIKNALLDAVEAKKKSVRQIEKILKGYRKARDLENEGATAIDDDWDKDIQETIDIAHALWGKNDPKK